LTKGQAKLIVTEKISTELMGTSKTLCAEIRYIKDNQNEIKVFFYNGSTIRVVPALDSARGSRSNVCTREEFRQIDKKIDDSVLSPFQIIRQPKYMTDIYYNNKPELKDDSIDVYISSSWYDDGSHWMWNIVDQAYNEMLENKDSVLVAFDESIILKHGIRTLKWMIREQKKQDNLTWRIEFLNERVKENESAFFQYSMFSKNQKSKQPWYPRQTVDILAGRKNQFDIPIQPDEIRVISCDIALMAGKKNDASVYTCARLIPEVNANNIKKYRIIVCYCESFVGENTANQAIRIHQLREDFHANYIVLDTNGVGRPCPLIWRHIR